VTNEIYLLVAGLPVEVTVLTRLVTPQPGDSTEQTSGLSTPGTYFPVIDEGFYVMLKPLPVGEHTLTIHGEFPSFDVVLDVTYHLTVVPQTIS
jgi:hypothetical protein